MHNQKLAPGSVSPQAASLGSKAGSMLAVETSWEIIVLSQALCNVATAAASIATVDYRQTSPACASAIQDHQDANEILHRRDISKHFVTPRIKQLQCFAAHSRELVPWHLLMTARRRRERFEMFERHGYRSTKVPKSLLPIEPFSLKNPIGNRKNKQKQWYSGVFFLTHGQMFGSFRFTKLPVLALCAGGCVVQVPAASQC